MSKKPVSWRPWKSLEVPHHVVPFGEDGGDFVDDGDQTHQGKQLIEGRQAGRLHLHEDPGELHPDMGLSVREGQSAVLIKPSGANEMPGCDVSSGGRRMCSTEDGSIR